MAATTETNAGPAPRAATPPPPKSFLRRPTTLLAATVIVGAAIAAAVIQGHGGTGTVAARVGPSVITAGQVQQEVDAIDTQPAYRAALSQQNTMALAAPVDPKAVAASGDPDDLRISLVPVNGASTTRPYTTQDLQASVLTRLMYVDVLQQVLASRHLTVTPAELADGREQARLESGQNAAGADLFDQLPGWYQDQLTERGADVEALEHALVGNGDITPSTIEAAYEQQLPTAFTEVCLRAAVVPAGSGALAEAKSDLSSGGAGSRDAGCAAMTDWASDVAGAVRDVPVGGTSNPVRRGTRIAVLRVSRRTTLPLSEVRGNVVASLSDRYTDLVNNVVEDQLALDTVTVSPQYGTYQSFGDTSGVLPPDALTPPPAAKKGPKKPVVFPRQKPDPFD